ncbi:MAG: hypothetical protein M1818_003030 [Claussenomyces sp. TS43310]|nr:MAG: hypothetical protein M1818_003030 [Claussenomyces sp. TS43310]
MSTEAQDVSISTLFPLSQQRAIDTSQDTTMKDKPLLLDQNEHVALSTLVQDVPTSIMLPLSYITSHTISQDLEICDAPLDEPSTSAAEDRDALPNREYTLEAPPISLRPPDASLPESTRIDLQMQKIPDLVLVADQAFQRSLGENSSCPGSSSHVATQGTYRDRQQGHDVEQLRHQDEQRRHQDELRRHQMDQPNFYSFLKFNGMRINPVKIQMDQLSDYFSSRQQWTMFGGASIREAFIIRPGLRNRYVQRYSGWKFVFGDRKEGTTLKNLLPLHLSTISAGPVIPTQASLKENETSLSVSQSNYMQPPPEQRSRLDLDECLQTLKSTDLDALTSSAIIHGLEEQDLYDDSATASDIEAYKDALVSEHSLQQGGLISPTLKVAENSLDDTQGIKQFQGQYNVRLDSSAASNQEVAATPAPGRRSTTSTTRKDPHDISANLSKHSMQKVDLTIPDPKAAENASESVQGIKVLKGSPAEGLATAAPSLIEMAATPVLNRPVMTTTTQNNPQNSVLLQSSSSKAPQVVSQKALKRPYEAVVNPTSFWSKNSHADEDTSAGPRKKKDLAPHKLKK